MSEEKASCPSCKTPYNGSQPDECSECAYPFAADKTTQSMFIARKIIVKSDHQSSKENVNRSRKILFAVAAIHLISAVFYFLYSDPLIGVVLVLVAGFALFCAILSYRFPFLAMLVALLMFLGLYSLDIIFDPASIARGLIWKAIVLGGLAYGTIDGWKIEKAKRK